MSNTPIHHFYELSGNSLTTEVHTYAMGLHDGSLSVDVNNQSGQKVTLTMHQTVSIVVWTVGQSDGLAYTECRREATGPEFVVDILIAERQHTDSYGPQLEMSYSDEIAMFVDNLDHLTFFDTLINMVDGSREHPWMKSEQTLLLTTFKINLSHHYNHYPMAGSRAHSHV